MAPFFVTEMPSLGLEGIWVSWKLQLTGTLPSLAHINSHYFNLCWLCACNKNICFVIIHGGNMFVILVVINIYKSFKIIHFLSSYKYCIAFIGNRWQFFVQFWLNADICFCLTFLLGFFIRCNMVWLLRLPGLWLCYDVWSVCHILQKPVLIYSK